jgi:hypothetical protein
MTCLFLALEKTFHSNLHFISEYKKKREAIMNKRSLPIIVVCFFLFALSATNATAITAFGNHPFYQPPLTSVSEFKAMMEEQKDSVRQGLKLAGAEQLYEPLMAQLPKAEVKTVQYPKGQTLEWMFFRKNGTGPVRVDRDVIWESETPFTGYEFYIDFKGNRYTFVVPLVCGNVALSDIGPIPPVAAAPVPVAAPAPEPKPAVMPEPVPEEVTPSPFAFVTDLGYLYQTDPAHHLFLRIGLEYKINENFSILGMVGAAPKVDGYESKSATMIDAMLNYNWTKAFIGFGLGGWITGGDSDLDTEDNGLDIIFDAGYQLYEKPESFKVSAFVELRSSVDEMSDFDMYGRVGGGLRFTF